MRLPHTTGADHPTPGIAVFQTMFSVALQLSGSVGSSPDTPRASDPRNCGQFSGEAARNGNAATDENKKRRLESIVSPREL
jgi:hypothetical protein